MAPIAYLMLALAFAGTAAPAIAHSEAAPPPRAMQMHLPLGRQANGAPNPSFKLAPAAPHKAGPPQPKTPEFNPLKRRRMAMPALDPEMQLAF
jgi:hypothetical protein